MSADDFLRTLSVQYHRPLVSLTAGAQRYLKRHPWVGNVRELRNVIMRTFLFSNSQTVAEQDVAQMCHLADFWGIGSTAEGPTTFRTAPKSQPGYRTSHTSFRRHEIQSSEGLEVERVRKALEETKWNKSKAAKMLHCSRMTIYRKIVQYELYSPARAPSEKE
jgi:two-component system, NtrC family, response regulator HydG